MDRLPGSRPPGMNEGAGGVWRDQQKDPQVSLRLRGGLRRQPREHRQRKGTVAWRIGEAMFLTCWDGGARLTGKS